MTVIPISYRVPSSAGSQTPSDIYEEMLSIIRRGFPQGADDASKFARANGLRTEEVDAALKVGVPAGYQLMVNAIASGLVELAESARTYAADYNSQGYGLPLDELDAAVEKGRAKASGLEVANLGLNGIGSLVD